MNKATLMSIGLSALVAAVMIRLFVSGSLPAIIDTRKAATPKV
jgi:hypothetical protein